MEQECCKHGQPAPRDILRALGESQGGTGRHKCAVCAYAEGYRAGFEAGLRAARATARQAQTGKVARGE
ncbi:MAG: hypothetical protein D6729_02135 [Deltaproteobacteria bacterium]|nr:MAG: hypothetical protein D6729_02135 [Deltaproteobacteria bacterium]